MSLLPKGAARRYATSGSLQISPRIAATIPFRILHLDHISPILRLSVLHLTNAGNLRDNSSLTIDYGPLPPLDL